MLLTFMAAVAVAINPIHPNRLIRNRRFLIFPAHARNFQRSIFEIKINLDYPTCLVDLLREEDIEETFRLQDKGLRSRSDHGH